MLSPRSNFVLCVIGSLIINATGLYLIATMLTPPRMVVAKKIPTAPRIDVFAPQPPPDDEMVIGKNQGAGESVNETTLDDVQTALKSTQDQANQTRDSTGRRLAESGVARPMASVFAPPPAALPTPPLSPAPAAQKYVKPAPKTDPSPRPPAPPRPPAAPAASPTAAPDAGRPAEHTDRDSDLFAKETSIEYRDGRVVAQSGREIKFARPRDNLAAIVDTATIPFPAILTMRIRVDEQGRVRNVRIVHSTGSSSLDRVYELATYESWFEPLKDKAGRPIADESSFTMTID